MPGISGFFASFGASGGNFKAGFQGAFTAAAFYGAGQLGEGQYTNGVKLENYQAVVVHGVVGCVTSAASGARCSEGFLSASFSKAATVLKWTPESGAGLIVSAAVGGTAAALGGGNFANGAVTAAFGYLFNCGAHDCWDKAKARLIDSNLEATDHYFNGDGGPAELGDKTKDALRTHPRVLQAEERLAAGATAPFGRFAVDMTDRMYHVGRTPVDYATACAGQSCTTTFTAFVRDGVWDIFTGNDRMGPQGELGGKPYPYKPYTWTKTYPNPNPPPKR